MGTLTILSPGVLTTVQDFGRPGFAALGISPCGAADPVALRIGNALVGNRPGAAALEMTLVGPALRFDSAAEFVLMGADLAATLDGETLAIGDVIRAKAGQVFKTAAAREAGSGGGCRCYLCIAGGIDVPLILGSASTHLESRLGGFQGRRVQTGDALRFRGAKRTANRRKLNPNLMDLIKIRHTLRVTEAIHTAQFTADAIDAFYRGDFLVAEQSSRLGLRLEGAPVAMPGEVLTTGVCLGTIQVPPSGQPIILFVDQQTTGGYPQIACVASVDHFRIGQLRPGDRIRFQRISFDEARRLYLAQEKLLAKLA